MSIPNIGGDIQNIFLQLNLLRTDQPVLSFSYSNSLFIKQIGFILKKMENLPVD